MTWIATAMATAANKTPGQTKPYDFSFDAKDGRFMFAQVYSLGTARQLDRYQATYNHYEKGEGLGVAGMFDLLHEVSCLVEDLECLTRYMENGSFFHEKHKLWKQARHHIRHDLRDISSTDSQKAMTRKRQKFLKFPAKMLSLLEFKQDSFLLGGHEIVLDEVADYLRWAEEINTEYVSWSRASGHMSQG